MRKGHPALSFFTGKPSGAFPKRSLHTAGGYASPWEWERENAAEADAATGAEAPTAADTAADVETEIATDDAADLSVAAAYTPYTAACAQTTYDAAPEVGDLPTGYPPKRVRAVAGRSRMLYGQLQRGRLQRFGIYPVGYLLGTVLGAAFPAWAGDSYDYLLLFFQTYLDGFCLASTAGELLWRHLSSQLFLLGLFLFCGYAVFGAPVLWLGLACKGALNGAVYTCVLTGLYRSQGMQFAVRYILYDLGGTAVLFGMVWALFEQCGALFHACLRKKPLPGFAALRWERVLTLLLGCFVWFLLCWLLSQSLFSPSAQALA